MSAGRARRLLARREGWLEAAGSHYSLRVGRDRRSPILLTLDEAGFRQLVEDPGLKARPGGGWVARSSTGRDPDRTPPGRPGLIEGIRPVAARDGQITAHRANLAHSAVAWLARRRDGEGRPLLNPAQVAAADLLGRDAEMALRGPSLTMRWDALPRSGSGGSAAGRSEPGPAALAAARRVEAALAACGSARGMVEAICIRASALQAAERDLGLRRREGRSLLNAGLLALAAHYRLG